METDLIFHAGFELPEFASFVLLDDERGVVALRDYYVPYVAIAREHGVGLILDTPTWRASPDWGARLGYTREQLEGINHRGVELVSSVRASAGGNPPIVISDCLGPRSDGSRPEMIMTAPQAQDSTRSRPGGSPTSRST